MICSTYNHINISAKSPAEESADIIYYRLVDSDVPMTSGMIVSACHKIKTLPDDVRASLWQRLRDGMSQEDYDRLHNFYIRFTLGQRWA